MAHSPYTPFNKAPTPHPERKRSPEDTWNRAVKDTLRNADRSLNPKKRRPRPSNLDRAGRAIRDAAGTAARVHTAPARAAVDAARSLGRTRVGRAATAPARAGISVLQEAARDLRRRR